MSDNIDTITALARLEEAERENQKLRSERLLAEHARDEAQREVGRVRDMLAIAERDGNIYRTNSYDWEADCGDWRKRAEAAEARAVQAESELFGMSTALQMVKEQLATAKARVRELEEALRRADNVRALYEDADARLRAVTEAGATFVEKFHRVRWGYDGDGGTAALVDTLETTLDAARTTDLPPHADTARLDWVEENLGCIRAVGNAVADSGDYSTTWEAVEYHISAPKERVIGYGYEGHGGIRAAIDAARNGGAK